jgi:hypothetical protein
MGVWSKEQKRESETQEDGRKGEKMKNKGRIKRTKNKERTIDKQT